MLASCIGWSSTGSGGGAYEAGHDDPGARLLLACREWLRFPSRRRSGCRFRRGSCGGRRSGHREHVGPDVGSHEPLVVDDGAGSSGVVILREKGAASAARICRWISSDIARSRSRAWCVDSGFPGSGHFWSQPVTEQIANARSEFVARCFTARRSAMLLIGAMTDLCSNARSTSVSARDTRARGMARIRKRRAGFSHKP